MTMPTAAQIEAAIARPTFQVRIHTGSAWVDVSADVLSVSGDARASSGDGAGFGLAPAPSFRVAFARERHGFDWDDRPIEIRLGFEGTNPFAFVGLIDGRSQDYDSGEWEANGYQALIAAAPEVRSPLLYRRPAFTATGAASVENPDDPAWRGGLGNYILWRTGGRPLAQAGAYPSAVYYYSCETALLAPEWSWCNGGDAAQTLDSLCRAAGGVLYQDAEGVVRYQEPMTFGAGSVTIHYTDSASAADAATRVSSGLAQYGGVSQRTATRRSVAQVVRCPFVQRRLQGGQQVYADQTVRIVDAGGTIGPVLDLQLPCLRLSHVELDAAVLATATATTPTAAATLSSAQQVTFSITNPLAEPIIIYGIQVFATPLVAVEEGAASHGTASSAYSRDEELPDSPYVQTESYARRLCHMYHDFYSVPRPVVELTGCGYDPRRALGERVNLTVAPWAMTAQAHRIIGMRLNDGITMDLELISVADLPTAAQLFVVGATYSGGNSRELIY